MTRTEVSLTVRSSWPNPDGQAEDHLCFPRMPSANAVPRTNVLTGSTARSSNQKVIECVRGYEDENRSRWMRGFRRDAGESSC